MTTEFVKLRGKSKWALLYDKTDDKYGSVWKLDLYMDEDSLKKYEEIGLQRPVRESEDGKYVSFKRDVFKIFNPKEGPVYFTPPRIYGKDGKVLVYYVDKQEGKSIYTGKSPDEFYRVGEPVSIGNGSEVEVTISTYNLGKIPGKGSRLESVKILDLIEYVREGEPQIEVPQEVKEDKKPKGKAPW